MLLPPPRSTLFPYTTLFRSLQQRASHHGRRARVSRPAAGRAVRRWRLHDCRAPEAATAERLDPQDRKSTRLNSSHTVISYAVFCLKKKKTNRQKHTAQYHTT